MPDVAKLMCGAFLIILLSGCADPGHTGPAGQDPNAWQTRGCVDKTLQTCYDNLGATVAIDETHVLPPLDEAVKTDLNGATIYADKVELQAFLPSPVQFTMFGLYPDRNTGVIHAVEATLQTDLFHVVSADDFQKAALFPILSAILGSECTSMTEAGLAQQFYDQMKPKIITDFEKHQVTRTLWYDTYKQHVPPFHLCGHDVLISMKWGDDIKKVTDSNEHGAYAYTQLKVQ